MKEYKVIKMSTDLCGFSEKFVVSEMESTLNSLAKEGWELKTTTPVWNFSTSERRTGYVWAIFERDK